MTSRPSDTRGRLRLARSPHDRAPWQRGSNENTNGLLRQYLPRHVSLRDYSQKRSKEVASTALTPSSRVPLAAQSRDDPEP